MNPRQIKLDRRAFADLAVNFHVPARLLDEPIHLREPQPGAVSNFLGREEGIKGPCYHVRRHTGARVGHGQHDVLTREHFRLRGGILFIEMNIGRFERQLAAIWHRVASVDGEIENCQLQLVGISIGAPHAASQHGFDRYLFAESSAQQVRHTGNEAAEINRLGIKGLLAREGEQPLGERFGPARAPHRIFGRAPKPFRRQLLKRSSFAARFRDCR